MEICHEIKPIQIWGSPYGYTQETKPDAFWLHSQLAKQDMASRDGFLCRYLHEGIGHPGPVERLLQEAIEVDSSEIPESVCLRWAILLLWFCSAADRRVRDRATKGLVSITQAHPKLWVPLIEEFAEVDDEYVFERCLCAAYGTLQLTRDADAERAVAAVAFSLVFQASSAFQNALIRDHARCIIELAHVDRVLPDDIDIKRTQLPLVSPWPLTIPSEEDLEKYDSKEYPKLHRSCLSDDFFIYTLPGLQNYDHIHNRKEMGRWILNHIIEEMAYGGRALAHYDKLMLQDFGGGRSRPVWAERIGKKYQWIALARLAARLADHAKPKVDQDWEPKMQGIPLSHPRGRDIDPSILIRKSPSGREHATWWAPLEYDFSSVSNVPADVWTTSSSDIPPTESLLQPIRRNGEEWLFLEGYPSWSQKANEDGDDSFKSHRRVWLHLRGYLVKRRFATRVFNWLADQDFMGRWMPEGAEFSEGYIGEYPWGVPFSLFPDQWHSNPSRKKAPARLIPVCNSVMINYEEDAYQSGTIRIHVPSRIFSDVGGQFKWDGHGGFRAKDGGNFFLDPSVMEAGPSALLVNRTYFLDFLKRHDLALVWTVLGEKIFIDGSKSPRLEFSRAHMIDQSGNLRSSTPKTKAN